MVFTFSLLTFINPGSEQRRNRNATARISVPPVGISRHWTQERQTIIAGKRPWWMGSNGLMPEGTSPISPAIDQLNSPPPPLMWKGRDTIRASQPGEVETLPSPRRGPERYTLSLDLESRMHLDVMRKHMPIVARPQTHGPTLSRRCSCYGTGCRFPTQPSHIPQRYRSGGNPNKLWPGLCQGQPP